MVGTMDAPHQDDLEDELRGLDESINELTVELGTLIEARDAVRARLDAARESHP